MNYKKLGSSTIRISTLGLGTNSIGNFQYNSQEKIRNRQKIYQFAQEHGINLFDTAELYGEGFAEYILGKTFTKKRDQIVISSKVNPDNCTSFALKRSLKQTLKRLGTDYIDLYQVHWINPFIELEETFTTLEELVLAGYIRAIGVCNFSTSMITQASKYLKRTQIDSNQIELNLFTFNNILKNLNFYRNHKISIIGYGLLQSLRAHFADAQQLFLAALQKEYNKTASQIIMSFFTSFTNVVILSKTDNIEHLKTNLNSFDFSLTPIQQKQFRKLFRFETKDILIKRIKLPEQFKKYSNHTIMNNQTDFVPSPLTIAQTYVTYNYFKPLNVLEHNGYYYLDKYDPYGEVKKYFAWKLLFNDTKPIPAFVFTR